MNKVIILLLITLISGAVYASNKISPKIQNHINADIALVHAAKQLSQSRGSGGYIGVGTDVSCAGVSTIQQALDLLPLTGATEIRVARNKIYNENLILDDIDVSIVGGYLNCFNMSLPDFLGGPGNNQSIINGGNNGSVIRVQNTTQRRNILLKNLKLVDGSGFLIGSKTTGGGLLSNQADALISLTNLDITGNVAFYGSGISIIDGNTDLLMINSRVFTNAAKYGAGIYCQSINSSVVLTDESGISLNITTGSGITEGFGDGGGVYVDSCYFVMYSGSINGSSAGISGNIAAGSGGGIVAKNGAFIILYGHKNCNNTGCVGDDTNPVNISSNIAGFSTFGGGGGIFSENSSISIFAGLISDNDGNSKGGGIYQFKGELLIERLKKPCWDPVRCNFFNNNSAVSGGAIHNFIGSANISSTVFEDNTADAGATIYSRGILDDFTTRIEGSLFNNNGDNETQSIVHSQGIGDVDFIHTTFADNIATDAIFESETYDNFIPSLEIHASIFDNQFIPVLNHDIFPYFVNISHVISNEIQTLSNTFTVNDAENIAGGSFIDFAPTFLDFPLFVDRVNRDYHLAKNSPAIDYAFTPPRASIQYKDIDFEERAWDDPTFTENYSLSYYDIGADESYGNDIIFKDDFE